MKNSGTVRMETKRLVLRPYVIEDADAMFRNWANDPQVTKYLTWEPHKDVEETKQILEGCHKSVRFVTPGPPRGRQTRAMSLVAFLSRSLTRRRAV